jgi:hypothetical protein
VATSPMRSGTTAPTTASKILLPIAGVLIGTPALCRTKLFIEP